MRCFLLIATQITCVHMASLPGLFPGPAESDHNRMVHESSYMDKFSPSIYQSVPPKLRNDIKYSEVRTLYSSIHDLQDDHPLLPVTLKEIRESGGFGEKWALISSEARAIASLKFLKLIVATNGTIYTQEAYKQAKKIANNYIPTSGVKLVHDREGNENMIPSTNTMTHSTTWADIRQPSHPNPTSILLLTAKHWPGSTLLGEIINADEHSLFFSEPCSALDIKLSSFGGEYGRLMGPSDGLDSLCAPLVLRLLSCEFTEEDTKLLMNDHYGLSKSARLREMAHHSSIEEQHKALRLTCAASAIKMVHEDRVLTKMGSDLISEKILDDKLRILHLVRDPRAILATRLELKNTQVSRVESESKKEFAVRMSKSLNTLHCDGAKFNIIDCIKNNCESYEHSVERTNHLLYQVFGKSTNLQLLSGVKQFLRFRYEDIMATPTISIEKIYAWFGNVHLEYLEKKKIVNAIEANPIKYGGGNRNQPKSNENKKNVKTSKHHHHHQQRQRQRKRRSLLYMNYHDKTSKKKMDADGNVIPDAYTPNTPKQEVAWDLLTERQLEVATSQCEYVLDRLEYSTAADKEKVSQGSVSLPAWAWTTIPPKKSLTIPSPKVEKKKYVYVKPDSWT